MTSSQAVSFRSTGSMRGASGRLLMTSSPTMNSRNSRRYTSHSLSSREVTRSNSSMSRLRLLMLSLLTVRFRPFPKPRPSRQTRSAPHSRRSMLSHTSIDPLSPMSKHLSGRTSSFEIPSLTRDSRRDVVVCSVSLGESTADDCMSGILRFSDIVVHTESRGKVGHERFVFCSSGVVRGGSSSGSVVFVLVVAL